MVVAIDLIEATSTSKRINTPGIITIKGCTEAKLAQGAGYGLNSLHDFLDGAFHHFGSAREAGRPQGSGGVRIVGISADASDVRSGWQGAVGSDKRGQKGERLRLEHGGPDSWVVSRFGAVMRNLENAGFTLRASGIVEDGRPATPSIDGVLQIGP